MKNLTIIFKPTYLCNLRCYYCYARNERDSVQLKMSIPEAIAAFNWISHYCSFAGIDHVNIIWHGGEPLLMGVNFYEEIISYAISKFKEYGIKLHNAIQTNATLITDDYIKLFKKYFDSKIGISLDYNSSYRVDIHGNNINKQLEYKLKILSNSNIQVGAICMISPENINNPIEMYKWFKQHNISFRANRMFPLSKKDIARSITAEKYIDFICKLFDVMVNDKHPLIVKTLEEYIQAFLTGKSRLCCLSGNCEDCFLAIAPDGGIFPCGRYSNVSYRLGNIYSHPTDVLKAKRSIIFSSIFDESAKLLNCKKCTWQTICHTGCPHAQSTGWIYEECKQNKGIWNYLQSYFSKMNIAFGALNQK